MRKVAELNHQQIRFCSSHQEQWVSQERWFSSLKRLWMKKRILLLIFHDHEKELLKKIELRSGNRKSKLPKSLFCYHRVLHNHQAFTIDFVNMKTEERKRALYPHPWSHQLSLACFYYLTSQILKINVFRPLLPQPFSCN